MKLRLFDRLVVLAMLTSLFATSAFAANGGAEAPFQFYTVLDGLTQSNVVDIEQDQAGYLWFSTARGLNRYDGKEFDQYTIADGLPHNSLTSIHVSATNTVWVGDVRGGVTAIHGARVVHVIEPFDNNIKPVLDIESIDSRMFVVLEDIGIVEITTDGGQLGFRHFIGEASTGITKLSVHNDDVWVESTTGLYRLDIGDRPRLELLAESVRKIHADATGALWVADTEGNVGIWHDSEIHHVVEIKSDIEIVGIATDRDNQVWVATSNELFNFDRREPASNAVAPDVREFSGLEDVTSLFVDRENSIWLSSESRLIRFLGDRFRHYRLLTESDPQTVWSISEDRHGRFWFGTQTKLLMLQQDESLTVVGEKFGIPKGVVRDIVYDGDRSLWVGITAQGLYHFDVDTMTATHVAASDNANVLDVAIAPDGAVWYSTIGSGVFRYDPAAKSMARFKTPEGTSVYSLDAGPDGSVWYGADEVGLVRLTPDKNGRFSATIIGNAAKDGDTVYSYSRLTPGVDGGFDEEILDPKNGLSKRLFNQISLTGRDSAWVATEEGGLYYFENDRFTDYGEATPLSDQTVYLVEPLDNGTVVVGGEQGLYQFRPGEAGIAHYNQQVGFIGLETNVHATFRDSSGHLWIGTVDGAARMDISLPMARSREPQPTIVRLETQLDGHPVLDEQEIEPQQLGVHIEYAAISLLNPRGIQYSYKLDGVDSDWGSPTTSRAVSYPRIPPGSYEFVVRARHPGGEWGSQVANQRFTVLPFFWQQPWFILICIIIAIFALRAFMIYRTRKIEWLNDTLRAQVNERTRSIEKARNALQRSNERLSKEIDARAEVETRFLNAFENAPIGMGLLDAEGVLFDANPALKELFWPALMNRRFADTIGDDDRERFVEHYESIAQSRENGLHERMLCVGATGEEIQAVINLSTVASEAGEFLYSVLQVQDVTEATKLTRQLEYQARYDELTGLPNRQAFRLQLNGMIDESDKSGNRVAVIYIDLDNFKRINDTLGHTIGDGVIISIAERLSNSVRSRQQGNSENAIAAGIARLGGDEFACAISEFESDEVLAGIAERIGDSLRKPVPYEAHEFVVTPSIGISIYPDDADNVEDLLKNADVAMYQAKDAGRDNVRFYSGTLAVRTLHGLALEHDLRKALENDDLELHYQPKLDLNTGKLVGAEALVRWRNEDGKYVPPSSFIPMAETSGQIVPLGDWVLRTACKQARDWQQQYDRSTRIAVNVSSQQFYQSDLQQTVMKALFEAGAKPSLLQLELTESILMRDVEQTIATLEYLKSTGITLAIDDFGTGYSSLSYLTRFPIDALKVDRSFVMDSEASNDGATICAAIIAMSRELGLTVIAEGVETQEQVEFLRSHDCDQVQGFLFSKPLPAEEFEERFLMNSSSSFIFKSAL